MNIFALILILIAVALFITGGLVEALNFLIWVAVVCLIVAVIMWALRAISGRK